ncbi:hypothetical protein VTN77DRAFT_7713 [Rasamsonia byssochlamydoides]|uniref:uncharacterized protein n=1 Tax=Rasamsonia byssochlamydoides TaxID=89139 RepID=UPI0037445EC2
MPFVKLSWDRSPLVSAISGVANDDFYSNFCWSNLELSIFPFDKIALKPVTPSDAEKTAKWHPVGKLPYGGKKWPPKTLKDWQGGFEPEILIQPGGIRNKNKPRLVLQLPYLSYEHFETSEFYRLGRSYDSYRKGSLEEPTFKAWLDEEGSTYGLSPSGSVLDNVFYVPTAAAMDVGFCVSPLGDEVEKHQFISETGAVKASTEGLLQFDEVCRLRYYHIYRKLIAWPKFRSHFL